MRRRFLFTASMWLMFGFMLSGMGSPSCTQSEHPLSSPEDGFVDQYLVGTWYAAAISEEGLLDAMTVFAVIEITSDGEMQVMSYGAEGDEPDIYRAWSTRVAADNVLNLQLIECPDCDEDEQRAIESGHCSFIFVRYFTYLPTELVDWISDDEVVHVQAIFENMRGNLALYEYMNISPVKDAIEAGEVEGDAGCEDCVWTGPCLTADQQDLRQFVASRVEDIFIGEMGLVSRNRTIEKTEEGLPVGMSRSGTITWIEHESDFLITSISDTEISAVGRAAEAELGEYAVFSFENDRLAGAVYSPIEEAPLLHRTVRHLINPRPEEAESPLTEIWLSAYNRRNSATLHDDDRETLRACITDLEQEPALASEQAAAEALTACMQEHGLQIEMGKPPVFLGAPACTAHSGWWPDDEASPPAPRPHHLWIPQHYECLDNRSTLIGGRFVPIDSDEPLLVSDVVTKRQGTLVPRLGFEFLMQSLTRGQARAGVLQIDNEDRPIIGEIECVPFGTYQTEDCDTPEATWCRIEAKTVDGQDQLRCINEGCAGDCRFHIVSDASLDDFETLTVIEQEIIVTPTEPDSDLGTENR